MLLFGYTYLVFYVLLIVEVSPIVMTRGLQMLEFWYLWGRIFGSIERIFLCRIWKHFQLVFTWNMYGKNAVQKIMVAFFWVLIPVKRYQNISGCSSASILSHIDLIWEYTGSCVLSCCRISFLVLSEFKRIHQIYGLYWDYCICSNKHLGCPFSFGTIIRDALWGHNEDLSREAFFRARRPLNIYKRHQNNFNFKVIITTEE